VRASIRFVVATLVLSSGLLPMVAAAGQSSGQPVKPHGVLPGAKVRPIDTLIPSLPTTVEVESGFAAIGAVKPIKALLKQSSSGQPAPGNTLSFEVGGASIGTAVTDSKGRASVDYKVPDSLVSKKIVVKFAGRAPYDPSSGVGNLVMVKAASAMTADGGTAEPGRTTVVSGQLVRTTDQRWLQGREIFLELDGKVVHRGATSDSGVFSHQYTVPSNASKPIPVVLRFGGDALYLPSSATSTIGIVGAKPKAYLACSPVTGCVGERVIVKIMAMTKLPYLPSNGLANQAIRLTRDRGSRWSFPRFESRVLGKATTNAAGIARVAFVIDDLPMGYSLHAHTISNASTAYDDVLISDAVMNVNRSPVVVSVACGKAKARIGDTLDVMVRVRRTSDNTGVKDVLVKLPKEHNIGYQEKKTNNSGIAVFSYTISNTGQLGSRTITVETEETPLYLKGSGSMTIEVLPKTN